VYSSVQNSAGLLVLNGKS